MKGRKKKLNWILAEHTVKDVELMLTRLLIRQERRNFSINCGFADFMVATWFYGFLVVLDFLWLLLGCTRFPVSYGFMVATWFSWFLSFFTKRHTDTSNYSLQMLLRHK